ncbi:hypothetical protein ACFX2A_002845 [Malus domestica]
MTWLSVSREILIKPRCVPRKLNRSRLVTKNRTMETATHYEFCRQSTPIPFRHCSHLHRCCEHWQIRSSSHTRTTSMHHSLAFGIKDDDLCFAFTPYALVLRYYNNWT